MAFIRGYTQRIAGVAVVMTMAVLSSCHTADYSYRSTETYTATGKERHAEPVFQVEITGNRFDLSSSRAPGLTVQGLTAPASSGRIQLVVTDARVFANWSNGWTEGRYEASGLLYLAPRSPFERVDDEAASSRREPRRERVLPEAHRRRYRISVEEPIELWTLQRGEVRYYDTYLRQDDGILAVSGRVDRIMALTEWLREIDGRPFFERELFAFVETPPSDAEPTWLAALRDSDSIARDRREAPGMFPLFYNLSHLNEDYFETLLLEEE